MRQIQILHGKGISELSAAGTLRFYERPPLAPVIHSSRSPREEWQRFLSARHDAVLELAALCDLVVTRLGQDMANIFFAHAVLLEDDDLTGMVNEDISSGLTAEYAVCHACEHFVAEFRALPDPYMQARAMDVLDVSRRLFRTHSTMILRSMEVAAIAQVEVPRDWNERQVLLDGATGRIYLEPDPSLIHQPAVRTPRRAPRQLQMR